MENANDERLQRDQIKLDAMAGDRGSQTLRMVAATHRGLETPILGTSRWKSCETTASIAEVNRMGSNGICRESWRELGGLDLTL